MYLLRFSETPMYAKVDSGATELVHKGSATQFADKASAEQALAKVGEFFVIEKQSKGKR
jgi:hydrogenase maturation factor